MWSGLQQLETSLLYQYVNDTLLPAHTSDTGGDAMLLVSNPSAPASPFSGHRGKFLNVDTDNRMGPKIPPTLLVDGRQYQLLVYHAIMSTVCLLVPAGVAIESRLIDRLDGHMGTALTNMSADLLDVFGRGGSDSSSDPLMLVAPPPAHQEVATSALPHSTSSGRLKSVPQSASVSSLKDLQLAPSEVENVKFVYYNETNRAIKNTFVLSEESSSSSGGRRGGQGCFPTWTNHSTQLGQMGDNSPETASFQEATHVIAEMSKEFAKLNRCVTTR